MFKRIPSTTLLMLAALGLVFGASHEADAHDGTDYAISSDKLKIQYDFGNSKKNQFQYKAKGQIAINDLSTDLTTVASSLIVRGTGVNDGDTGVILLDPALWSAIGSKGWKYKGDTEDANGGGIKQIKIMTHPTKGGRLQVKAKGQYWAYDLVQPQSSIEISLNLDEQIFCAQYGATPSELTRNEGDLLKGKAQGKSSAAIAGGECPSVCGNAQLELGEECDDGNTVDNDTCNNECLGCASIEEEYESTFEGIQALIFDSPTYNCSNDLCHGAGTSGGLDLRDGTSYSQLINVASPNWTGNPLRVFPGDQDPSLLYSKLAHGTNGTPTIAGTGTPMPSGAPPLTDDHLEAIRLWIRGGAPEDSVVAGTSELLGACLPPAAPNKIAKPPAPDVTEGVQFAMPGYELLSQSERELCVTSYYDVSADVPAEFRVPCPFASGAVNGPENECFAWNYQALSQDPQSHHSIIHIYTGTADTTDPGWGGWTCYTGDNHGGACDPLNPVACTGGGICGGADVEGIACLSLDASYGPSDFGNAQGTIPTFGGAQEPTGVTNYPAGVYNLMPVRGIIVWNSHAFNLTGFDMNMEAWLNMEFTSDTQYFGFGLFDIKNIFIQNVAPFETEEYCDTHTFAGTGTVNLFDISSHTHQHGKRWRFYQAPQVPCVDVESCSPGDPGDMFYESFEYSDPVYLEFDPPIQYPYDAGDLSLRTIKYCSLYDNGAVDPTEVKRRSTSPCPPAGGCDGNPLGGPCALLDTYCIGGPSNGLLCVGDDNLCPSGECDACYARGGVTTADEMFIPLGSYFYTP